MDPQRLRIGGVAVVSRARQHLEMISPVTEERTALIPESLPEEIDAAVTAARSAQREWAALTALERARRVQHFADVVEKNADELARTVTVENGQVRALALRSVGSLVAALRYYAEIAGQQPELEVRPPRTFAGELLIQREPIGVVGIIVPWNYPLGLIGMKLAPALASGCAVVIKPAVETSLDALLLADLAAKADLPAGIINVVTGGRDAGAALVAHPGLQKVSFTGSSAAGRSIAAACGQDLRRVTLELGGKSAAIVLSDADLAATLEGLKFLSFANAGQSCFLNSRVLVHRSLYDQVVRGLVEIAGAFVLGAPDDKSTTMGPLVSAAQRARVESYVDIALAEGATLASGGRRALERGYFFEPTVFVDVDHSMRIVQEEVFGPVVCVMPFDDDDQAVEMANATSYGLAGSVWSADIERATAMARRIETGSIGVNMWTLDQHGPFGGWKTSGLGKELGPEGLAEYQQVKTIDVPAQQEATG